MPATAPSPAALLCLDRGTTLQELENAYSTHLRASLRSADGVRLARRAYADVGPLKIESDLPDEKVLFLSDIFPTGYMAAENADQAGEIDPSLVITHRVPLSEAPAAYKAFRDKKDGCIKVVLKP